VERRVAEGFGSASLGAPIGSRRSGVGLDSEAERSASERAGWRDGGHSDLLYTD
jgi:hypothetical protein